MNNKKTPAKKTDSKKTAPKSEAGKKLKVKRLTVGDLDQDVRGGSDTNCQANTVC